MNASSFFRLYVMVFWWMVDNSVSVFADWARLSSCLNLSMALLPVDAFFWPLSIFTPASLKSDGKRCELVWNKKKYDSLSLSLIFTYRVDPLSLKRYGQQSYPTPIMCVSETNVILIIGKLAVFVEATIFWPGDTTVKVESWANEKKNGWKVLITWYGKFPSSIPKWIFFCFWLPAKAIESPDGEKATLWIQPR